MKTYLSKLNPTERRIVVFVAVLFFVVINLFFVWPHYADLAMWGTRRGAAERKLANYNETIRQATTIEPMLRKLEGSGANVPAEDQSVQFLQTIQRQASQNGVLVVGNGRQITKTNNQFFVEQEQSITVQSGEEPLVNFLVNLGSGDSLIRVRSLTVRPDQQRQQLIAQITLVASYQKNPKPQVTTPATKPATAPAAAPVARPNVTPTAPAPAPQTAPAKSAQRISAPGTDKTQPVTPKKP